MPFFPEPHCQRTTTIFQRLVMPQDLIGRTCDKWSQWSILLFRPGIFIVLFSSTVPIQCYLISWLDIIDQLDNMCLLIKNFNSFSFFFIAIVNSLLIIIHGSDFNICCSSKGAQQVWPVWIFYKKIIWVGTKNNTEGI